MNVDPAKSNLKAPLIYGGSLDGFDSFEVTPLIGREYINVQLSDLLYSEDAEKLVRDLAIIISQRGVVFFRNQNIDIEDQKRLTQQLGLLSGKPATSGLHVHPLHESPENEPMDTEGNTDEEVFVVSSRAQDRLYKGIAHRKVKVDSSAQWHSDNTMEVCPSDYSFLKMKVTPESGGDTLWASAYAVYDRISDPFRSFLDGLTATYAQPIFSTSAARVGIKIHEPRGSPLNVGDDFSVVHPVVRTNPVTGWRGIFAVGLHCQKINDVSAYEDKSIRDYFLHLITHNHDLQARIKWGPNDVAIWDNPDVFGATRIAVRTNSIGEKPYFDPKSQSQADSFKSVGNGVNGRH
ncbi:taurine catabolism dioxygenase TauD, TfdA family protein [Sistotremastrum suecicum HHB10207 ss-3]|uniref:Taurine catabolism dioxygenase TauD, TfdA family protein n=1 Tax=Sistotremastrum suecicum HHB10207 ss-3 TaxID=1314776 RepID=A0A166G8H6_9AGAM|nr:taurine catabolism dioxygenase TauD, TfdA family protein [Sistotremastrum suecicum HHB10207 ss-3]